MAGPKTEYLVITTAKLALCKSSECHVFDIKVLKNLF